jgi:hypothetical protein
MKKKLTTPQKISLGFAIGTIAFIVAPIVVRARAFEDMGRTKFYATCRTKLSKVTKPEQDEKFAEKLNKQEWYTMRLEHSCCSGAGFDAVIIKDSTGNIYTKNQNFCGYEGFMASRLTKATSIQELQRNLLQAGFKKDK